MEQLGPIACEFSAFVRREDGSPAEFSFAISHPRDSGEGDSVCSVFCPFLRTKPYQIYGVDHEQALQLSRRFIEINLECRNLALVDAQGQPLELPPVPTVGS
jgi:hypothetical protein